MNYLEYWLLQQQDQLYKIFQEIKNNIHFFLQLYRQAKAACMNIQDVIRALRIAKNDLRSIEYRCLELKRQEDSLVAGNANLAKTLQDLSDQISDLKRIIAQDESVIIERKLELQNLSVQKNNLEAGMTFIRNNSAEYSRIIEAVKREMKGTLTDPRQILMLTFQSIVESARKDDSKLFALIYNLPTASSHFPDYNTNENNYERILLNKAEDLYNMMIADHLNNAIGTITSKSDLPFKPQDELDNIGKDSASFRAYRYRREEHTFIQSESNNDIKKDDYNFDEGQII